MFYRKKATKKDNQLIVSNVRCNGFPLPYGILPYLRTLMNIDKLNNMLYYFVLMNIDKPIHQIPKLCFYYNIKILFCQWKRR